MHNKLLTLACRTLDKSGGLLLLSLRGTARVALTTSGSSIVYKENKKTKVLFI